MEEAVPEQRRWHRRASGPRPGQNPPGIPGSVEGTLTQQDRILIVAQAIQMLDNFYVHRPLKEAIPRGSTHPAAASVPAPAPAGRQPSRSANRMS